MSPEAATFAVQAAAKDVETLAGAGDLTHARMLAARILAQDNSGGTTTLLQAHAIRAGHPELLAPPPQP
jgi:hypothetical protein